MRRRWRLQDPRAAAVRSSSADGLSSASFTPTISRTRRSALNVNARDLSVKGYRITANGATEGGYTIPICVKTFGTGSMSGNYRDEIGQMARMHIVTILRHGPGTKIHMPLTVGGTSSRLWTFCRLPPDASLLPTEDGTLRH